MISTAFILQCRQIHALPEFPVHTQLMLFCKVDIIFGSLVRVLEIRSAERDAENFCAGPGPGSYQSGRTFPPAWLLSGNDHTEENIAFLPCFTVMAGLIREVAAALKKAGLE